MTVSKLSMSDRSNVISNRPTFTIANFLRVRIKPEVDCDFDRQRTLLLFVVS